jgi:hypothetical protein
MVPVLDSNRQPLMPCSEKRARLLMGKGQAKPLWRKGIFCVILQREPSDRKFQDVTVGVDPGSKRTGITVVTDLHVVLNMLVNAPVWVKDQVELRKTLRRGRRGRKTPYRKCRFNRKIGEIPPSTKSRWQAHLRVIDALSDILPVTDVVVEDVCAESREGKRRWNVMFSPIQVGKKWFAGQVVHRGLRLHLYRGFETFEWRNARGFKKTKEKLKDVWEAHCVDSHCLCEILVGPVEPFKGFYRFDFMQWHRRQLHVTNPTKGGERKCYGSTVSLGVPRGTLVRHNKYGLSYVGGTSNGRLSLHSISDGKRLCQNARKDSCKFMAKQIWNGRFLKRVRKAP